MSDNMTKALNGVGTIVNTLGQAKSQSDAGSSYAQAGQAERAAAYAHAQGLDQNAGQTRATSQQQAYFDRRSGRFAASRALAQAAASGGGAADPSVIKIISDLKGESEYQALADMASGESRARSLEYQGVLDRYGGDVSAYTGKVRKSVARQQALNTIAKGAQTLFDRYGGDGPPTVGDNITWDTPRINPDLGAYATPFAGGAY